MVAFEMTDAPVDNASLESRARQIREQSRTLVAHAQDVRDQSDAIMAHLNAIVTTTTILWRIKARYRNDVRCELDSPCEGSYRLRVLRLRDEEPLLVETQSNRLDAIRRSVTIYRELKGRRQQRSDQPPSAGR